MKQFYELIERVIKNGQVRCDRTAVGTLSVFGGELDFDLVKSFPLVTFKETKWRSAFIEMLWFLRGEPNINYLHENNVHIWDEWADERGNLGPIYGVQWRSWPGKVLETTPDESGSNSHKDFLGVKENRREDGTRAMIYQEHIDQIANLIEMIKTTPHGRRHIVTAWNPGFIKEMGLPPCHYGFQCYVNNNNSLDLKMHIRSWDLGLGGSFNIAQYALLTHLIARATNLTANRLIISYGDAHVYENHVTLLSEHMALHKPIDASTKLVISTDNTNIDGYSIKDFSIENYECGPFLKLPIAV